jgi:hypothetical protein
MKIDDDKWQHPDLNDQRDECPFKNIGDKGLEIWRGKGFLGRTV